MKKIVVHRPGGYERLVLEEHPDPVPVDDEVLVATRGIGVNYADCCVRWGVYESAKRYVGWPITPGFEFSGTVVQAGPEATHRVGDDVFGITRFGGYSTHVRVRSAQAFARPSGMEFEHAAAFTAANMTAYHAVRQIVRLPRSGTVLVHSAAGGVGSALLQICKIEGLRCVAVVGATHKVEHCQRLGADVVIDKSKEDLWRRAEAASPHGYDAVFDANGYTTYQASYDHLSPSGKLICYGSHSLLPRRGGHINYLRAGIGLLRTPAFRPKNLISGNKSVVGFNLSFLFHRSDLLADAMAELLTWNDEGVLTPPAVQTFPLEEVAEAHAAIESGRTVGKLVLVP